MPRKIDLRKNENVKLGLSLKNHKFGKNCLILAAEHGYFDLVKLFVEAGRYLGSSNSPIFFQINNPFQINNHVILFCYEMCT